MTLRRLAEDHIPRGGAPGSLGPVGDRDAWALAVRCPRCDARADDPCTGEVADTLVRPHAERVEAARKANLAPKPGRKALAETGEEAKVYSFKLRPIDVAELDALVADERGDNKSEALRWLLDESRKRRERRTK